MQIFYKTDVGLMRRNNQDYCLCEKVSEELAWAVVCDGMGGANGGNVASNEACDEIGRILREELKPDLSEKELRELMEKAVSSANEKVYEMSCYDENLSGMGTTVELVVVSSSRLYVVHAGDSRVYRITSKGITQVTTDHSLVQQLVELGQITQEEARFHPSKNYITRALGVEPTLEVDFLTEPFEKGDIIIVCTDGLSNYFSTEELFETVKDIIKEKEELAQCLVDVAKDCGGSDNITVAVLINE